MLIRSFLLFVAAMFLGFGIWSAIDPAQMTSQLGVTVSGPAGLFEMRGVFGGVSLGAGALCLGGALRHDMARPALWFILSYMGGYVIGRLASFIAGDSATMTNWTYAVFEALLFAAAALLLQKKH